MLTAVIMLNWIAGLLWAWRASAVRRNLPRLPDLLQETGKPEAAAGPQITVIVPARNEEQDIEETLRSLLAQQDVSLEILAVNDRSTDKTGEIMDRVAAEGRARSKSIGVIHIQALPPGWMGKTHAMALAARQAAAPWLLFTDGDILFREDCLCRALRYAEREADHLVLFPTFVLKTAGERMMLSAIQALAFLFTRPWKVADPKSRESLGIGAFNLIRSTAYRSIGGYEGHPMEILEDIKLGRQVKQHGLRQRVVLGRGLIRVHWAAGALGIVRNLTKNIFAVFRFNPAVLLAASIGIALFCVLPFAGLFGPWQMLCGSILGLGGAVEAYRSCERRIHGIPAAYVLLLPVAGCMIAYMLLRSMVVTLMQRGVVWRGTFYPLAELRRHAGPLR